MYGARWHFSKYDRLVIFLLAVTRDHERSRFSVTDWSEQAAFENASLLYRLCYCEGIARVQTRIAE